MKNKSEHCKLKDKLKQLPPIVVYNKLELYKIPTPYKEIIIATCINKLPVETAIVELKDKYDITLGYWDFISKTNKALKMMNKSESLF